MGDMKHQIPRPVIDSRLLGIICREIKKQDIPVYRLSKRKLVEMAETVKEIQAREIPKHLILKKLSHGLGHGIFLRADAEPILKDRVIASYGGIITVVAQNERDDNGDYAFAPLEHFCLTKEEHDLWDRKYPYHPRRQYALKLDALKKGNFTRFINHSVKPNVYADMVKIPANNLGLDPAPIEIVYLSQKTIHPGEQLLICYEAGEKSYWNASGIKPFPMTPRTFRVDREGKLIHLANRCKLCDNRR
jgi:hypothetical protein